MLTKREYLGPTSTDTELAFLVCNQAQITSESVVFDPFCGTESILVAAAHFRAMCFGADIDMRVLRGWSVGRSTSESPGDIFTNFGVYGLTPPEIIRNDVSHLEVYRAIRCSHLRPSLWDPRRVS
jgi:tRNA (guanine10-N2)-methyltransferase